jgi:RNA polymerase sigma-70 factor (ECF subfamily)
MGLAYRLLGSWAEAEDVLQEAWLRWSAADTQSVENNNAWLTRVVTNLCLDVLKSSRVKRESYVGPWLPEPIMTSNGMFCGEPADPRGLSMAFLCLLERLSPLERAVYILAEAFDYTHEEIGSFLSKDTAAVRQLLHRAREHVRQGNIRYAPDKEAHKRVLEAFAMAVATGDTEGMGRLLAADVVAHTDGGGRVRAALNSIRGVEHVTRLMTGLKRKADPGLSFEAYEVNGWPGAALTKDGVVGIVFDIETDGQQIFALHVVVNPDKLRFFTPGV